MGPKCKNMVKMGLNFEPRAQPKSKKWSFFVYCRWRIGFCFFKNHFDPRAEGSTLLINQKNSKKWRISNEKRRIGIILKNMPSIDIRVFL